MKLNRVWTFFLTMLGGLAQYYWMQSVPSLNEQALNVSLATAISCIISLFTFKKIIRSKLVLVFLLVLTGTVTAVAAYWALNFFASPDVIYILKKHNFVMFGFSAFVMGGWVVGLLCGLSQWLQSSRDE